MVGGAGSANAMRHIQDKDSVLEATVIYPHTQAADGIKLARLIAQDKSLSDLTSQGVPRRIVLSAPVVTKDNVDQYSETAFEPGPRGGGRGATAPARRPRRTLRRPDVRWH